MSISELWIIRLSVREACTPHPTRYAATYIRYSTFLRRRVIMARYTLKRPVCAITSWKPNVSSSTSGKAGRRSLQFATRRRCSDDAPRRESAFARHQLVCIPSWNGGLEMIISKRPFTSEKTLLAKTSPSTPLVASVARLASTAGAETHRVRRIFGEWRAKATESTPAPQPTSSTLPFVCGLASRAATDCRHPDRRG